MKQVNQLIAILLLLAVAPLWIISARFPDTAIAFPRLFLALIAILAAVILVKNLIPGRRAKLEGEGKHDPRALGRPLAAFAAGCGSVYLMSRFGFFPAMLAFAAVLVPALGVARRRIYVVTLAALLVFTYIIFTLLLGVPLTAGSAGPG